jgi:hypothetical protein
MQCIIKAANCVVVNCIMFIKSLHQELKKYN